MYELNLLVVYWGPPKMVLMNLRIWDVSMCSHVRSEHSMSYVFWMMRAQIHFVPSPVLQGLTFGANARYDSMSWFCVTLTNDSQNTIYNFVRCFVFTLGRLFILKKKLYIHKKTNESSCCIKQYNKLHEAF